MRDRVVTGLGVTILALFAGMTLYMLRLVGATETEWARAAYLFAGVEAIAFAAAGYLFGRAAHRERAERAEQARLEAEERARSLAQAVRNTLRVKPGPGWMEAHSRLVELADRLDSQAPATGAGPLQ